jgi:V/A-type H+/Na+-transporting ATPase subunit E
MGVSDPQTSGSGAARLVGFIREQCAVEADTVIAQAQERAQRARAAAAAEAESIRAAARRQGEARGRRRAAEILTLADAESHREWLQAREQLIDAAIAQAWHALARFPEMPDATQVLTRLIAEALAALPPGAVRIHVPEAYDAIFDAAQHTGAIPNGRVVHVEKAALAGGVIVETEDGRVRFDNSFDARGRRRREALRRLVADTLFSEASPAEPS